MSTLSLWLSHSSIIFQSFLLDMKEHTCSSLCDHSLDDPHRGSEESLYNTVDLDNIVILNGKTLSSSSLKLVRPWFERFNLDNNGAPIVESDCDAQLIVKIPFTASIKLKSIIVYSSHGIHCPRTMKA